MYKNAHPEVGQEKQPSRNSLERKGLHKAANPKINSAGPN